MASLGTASSRERRIACLQLDSKHADVSRNIDTVLDLVSNLILDSDSNSNINSIDLLVLPELALTGYVFETREEINPFLEDATTFLPPSSLFTSTSSSPSTFITACRSSCASSSSPSLTLGAHLAQQLRCHVVIGFPERISHEESSSRAPSIGAYQSVTLTPPFDARPKDVRISSNGTVEASPDQTVNYRASNSAALFAPDGSLQHVFRKHFLFETDEKWASAGSGFESLHIPDLGNVCVAICMDLNPFQFRTPFDYCELASFCVQRDVDLLVMPMAWLLPKHQEPRVDSSPSLSTISYWAMRCLPFFNPQTASTQPSSSATAVGDAAVGNANPLSSKMRYLAATNRVGTEAKSTFAGSSCVLQMKVGQRPLLLDSLGTKKEACLLVTLPP
ncbi:related to NTA1 - Amidase [Ustilago sp. UG-2017b]|nr:related to NTA1 - Amidase [Ustilago sp. UG-2017b]